MAASVGTVTVKVVPDLTEFMDTLTSTLSPWFSVLLMQYSEWLDANQGLIKPGDDRTHDDLVKQFIAQRSPVAQPLVRDQAS